MNQSRVVNITDAHAEHGDAELVRRRRLAKAGHGVFLGFLCLSFLVMQILIVLAAVKYQSILLDVIQSATQSTRLSTETLLSVAESALSILVYAAFIIVAISVAFSPLMLAKYTMSRAHRSYLITHHSAPRV